MDIKHTKNNGSIEIKIHVKGSNWEELIKKAEKKLLSNFELKGFRKGQVPTNIAKQHIGNKRIQDSALEILLETQNEKIMTILQDAKIVSRPMVDIEKISDTEAQLIIKATLSPEVKLGNLENLKSKIKLSKITKEELERESSAIESLFKTLKPISDENEKVKIGHTVDIDFVGSVDGKEFEGGKAQGHKLKIGSKTFIDNFEDQLIGLKIKEEKVVKVTFPKVYPVPELANKKADFHVKLNSILVEENLSEEEAKTKLKQFGHESRESMLKSIEHLLQERKDDEAKNSFFLELMEEISSLKGTEIEIPHEMIASESEEQLKTFENQLLSQGMNLDSYLKQINKTHEEFLKDEIHSQSKKRIKHGLIYSHLLEHYKINVDEKDLEKEIERIAKQQNMDINAVKKQIKADHLKNSIQFNKLIEKFK